MAIVLVINAVLAALVLAVVVGSLGHSISVGRGDHPSLGLRLRPARRVASAEYAESDVVSA